MFTKPCPRCDKEMHKDCNSTETKWWWQCDCCDYIETPIKKELVIVIEPYHSYPCRCELFTINGENADEEDFGSTKDVNHCNAEPWGCGKSIFLSTPATQEVLNKYGITLEDYSTICAALESKLYVGKCGWCV